MSHKNCRLALAGHAAAALEVGDGNHLAMFPARRIAVADIAACLGDARVVLAGQICAQDVDVGKRVAAPTAFVLERFTF